MMPKLNVSLKRSQRSSVNIKERTGEVLFRYRHTCYGGVSHSSVNSFSVDIVQKGKYTSGQKTYVCNGKAGTPYQNESTGGTYYRDLTFPAGKHKYVFERVNGFYRLRIAHRTGASMTLGSTELLYEGTNVSSYTVERDFSNMDWVYTRTDGTNRYAAITIYYESSGEWNNY